VGEQRERKRIAVHGHGDRSWQETRGHNGKNEATNRIGRTIRQKRKPETRLIKKGENWTEKAAGFFFLGASALEGQGKKKKDHRIGKKKNRS